MAKMRAHRSVSRRLTPQRALIVGVGRPKQNRAVKERSLDELARLIDTAGGVVAARISQEVRRADPATFFGKGKVEEIALLATEAAADLVAVDWELTPVQNKNLEDRMGLLVLDRTAVILDIFARRAATREGKLQVELAQLKYLAPRLVGRGKVFSQQVGRIGTRGPGETALEYDRRRVKDRIAFLKGNLERVRSHRRLHRAKRDSVPVPMVSLVGYTNAGKSTLMNALTGAGVFVEDKLFATLDPTVRRMKLPSGREILIADTVGFISRLPHQLIEAFKSTFEEAASSAVLLHVIDASDEEARAHAEVVEKVLSELGMAGSPRIDAVNKCDCVQSHYRGDERAVRISALTGEGLPELVDMLDRNLRVDFRKVTLLLPMERGDVLSEIYRVGHVDAVKYGSRGIKVECRLHEKQCGRYREFTVR